MEFEKAYDLEIQTDKEVVFVQCGNRHRKVRVLVAETDHGSETVTFSGRSLGSSVKEIKASKKDEPPVAVKGHFRSVDGTWKGTLESVN